MKLYTSMVFGSTPKELDPAERWVWIGFLVLAGDSQWDGIIKATETIGFSDAQLADLLAVDLRTLRSAKRKMLRAEKIAADSNGIISILNWEKYQSEYDRQKKFRGKKLQAKVIGDSYALEEEGEREEEKNKEEKKKSPPPLPAPSDPEYQKFLKEAVPEIARIFKENGFEKLLENKTFYDYLLALCWKHRFLELSTELERKLAHLRDNPPGPKSNLCLQFRNWFRLAVKFENERRRELNVGRNKYKPEP